MHKFDTIGVMPEQRQVQEHGIGGRLVETRLQALSVPAEGRQMGRTRRRVLPALHRGSVQWRLARSPPQHIEALVADDAGEPGHRGPAAAIEAVRVAPDKDECILHDVP
jgi:hypothetical protein